MNSLGLKDNRQDREQADYRKHKAKPKKEVPASGAQAIVIHAHIAISVLPGR